MKTAILNVRVNPEIKAQAESLYDSFGLNITDAINMFLIKSVAENGLPFELKQKPYNKKTDAAIMDAKQIAKELNEGKRKGAGSFKSLRAELGV